MDPSFGNASRRRFLKLGLTGGLLLTAAPLARLAGFGVHSPSKLPVRFSTPLPIPPVLEPFRVDETGVHYALEQREDVAHLFPGQATRIWGYNGLFPGPTIRARRGVPAHVHHTNHLSTPTVVHLHGGRTPADSDGFPNDFVIPRGFSAADFPICGTSNPDSLKKLQDFASSATYTYPNDQRAATLWYHDHAMGGTGKNVYMGLAGFYLIDDEEASALQLPAGAFDVPLMICTRQFDDAGQLVYADHGKRGASGDTVLVNGAPWPVFRVERRRYRFRLLNACNATTLTLALSEGSMTLIATDGGLVEQPLSLDTLPLAMAERADVVIDFSRYPAGQQVMLHNREALGTLGDILRFEVTEATGTDDSAVPAKLTAIAPLTPPKGARERSFVFGARPEFVLRVPPIYWSINGQRFDPERVDADPVLGDVEVWRFIYARTMFPTSVHPAHIHAVQFQILTRNGEPPAPHERGWKDTVRLVEGDDVRVAVRFDAYPGRYLLHCHNLEHEDHDMMARFDIRPAAQNPV
ncbi:multicopper oxidase domain-containing protein [Dyella sp. GSA-30]|uniref:multicopper oxidase family protein n=1 Tax=Dyella sp. GSA-30 TaxID=2994496 RepID=UPI00249248B2|nr:multicopper oxidase domain-containing protein [Dyella sp. GSA-30]